MGIKDIQIDESGIIALLRMENEQKLRRVAEEFGMEFDDLTQVPEYAEYVKSPQYRQWLESQR